MERGSDGEREWWREGVMERGREVHVRERRGERRKEEGREKRERGWLGIQHHEHAHVCLQSMLGSSSVPLPVVRRRQQNQVSPPLLSAHSVMQQKWRDLLWHDTYAGTCIIAHILGSRCAHVVYFQDPLPHYHRAFTVWENLCESEAKGLGNGTCTTSEMIIIMGQAWASSKLLIYYIAKFLVFISTVYAWPYLPSIIVLPVSGLSS